MERRLQVRLKLQHPTQVFPTVRDQLWTPVPNDCFSQSMQLANIVQEHTFHVPRVCGLFARNQMPHLCQSIRHNYMRIKTLRLHQPTNKIHRHILPRTMRNWQRLQNPIRGMPNFLSAAASVTIPNILLHEHPNPGPAILPVNHLKCLCSSRMSSGRDLVVRATDLQTKEVQIGNIPCPPVP